MDEKTLGQTAWEAYRQAVGGVAFNGEPLPEFKDMDDTRKTGWETAAAAVAQRFTDAACAAATCAQEAQSNTVEISAEETAAAADVPQAA